LRHKRSNDKLIKAGMPPRKTVCRQSVFSPGAEKTIMTRDITCMKAAFTGTVVRFPVSLLFFALHKKKSEANTAIIYK